jgi:hypothetical protein
MRSAAFGLDLAHGRAEAPVVLNTKNPTAAVAVSQPKCTVLLRGDNRFAHMVISSWRRHASPSW